MNRGQEKNVDNAEGETDNEWRVVLVTEKEGAPCRYVFPLSEEVLGTCRPEKRITESIEYKSITHPEVYCWPKCQYGVL